MQDDAAALASAGVTVGVTGPPECRWCVESAGARVYFEEETVAREWAGLLATALLMSFPRPE